MPRTSAVIRVRNSTHMLVGWYKPEEIDPLGLRATEIKGLWRWWARAFVAGALYELGYLSGDRDHFAYLRPTSNETKIISKIVGVQLGLGYVDKNESEASRFKVLVEPLSDIARLRVSSSAMQQYQRVRLLSLKGSVYAIMPGGEFSINISWDSEHKRSELALRILLVALQFSGIGKGGRRGLGSLDITDLKLPFSIDKDVSQLIDYTYNECKKLVQEVIEDLNRRGSKGLQQKLSQELPPLSVVAKKPVEVLLEEDGVVKKDIQVTEFYVIDSDFNKFIEVDNFFVRTERCRKLFNNAKCYDSLRQKRYAWFLGLPRSQRKSEGYVIARKEDVRRASPIHIAFHDEANMFGRGIFMAIFLSGDWPKSIEWLSRRSASKTIHINSNTIASAYNVFINEFKDYLQKVGLRLGTRLWP